jgi:hypothetical protein
LTVCHTDGKVMLQSAIFPVLLLGACPRINVIGSLNPALA